MINREDYVDSSVDAVFSVNKPIAKLAGPVRKQHKGNRKSILLTMTMLISAIGLSVTVFHLTGLFYDLNEDEKNTALTAISMSDDFCTTGLATSHAATEMFNKMNVRVNPCEDFERYACDGYKRIMKPTSTTPENILRNRFAVMRGLLEEGNIKAEDPSYVVKLKNYFKSCLQYSGALPRTEIVSWSPPFSFVFSWPSANPDWTEKYSLKFILQEMAKHSVFPLFDLRVETDPKNEKKHVVFVTPPVFPLLNDALSTVSKDRDKTEALQYLEHYYFTIARTFSKISMREHKTIKQDAKEVVNLQQNLTKLMRKDGQQERRTLKSITDEFSGLNQSLRIDYAEIIKRVFETIGIDVRDDEEVVIENLEYFKQLPKLINQTDSRTLNNFLLWSFVQPNLATTTIFTYKSTLEYLSILHHESPPKRETWEKCVDNILSVLDDAANQLFISKYFGDREKINIRDVMLKRIKKSVRKIIKNMYWPSKSSKKRGLEKIDSFTVQFGSTDHMKANSSTINKIMSQFKFHPANYFANEMQITVEKGIKKRNLRKLHSTLDTDRDEFKFSPFSTNVSFMDERIGIPAAVFQIPYYSRGFTKSLLYGAFGTFLANQMFRSLNELPPLGPESWLNMKDAEKLSIKLEPVREIYGNLTVYNLDNEMVQVDGNTTVYNNMNDILALKAAFNAFENIEDGIEELPLPGIYLTPSQQFYVAFAQTHCEKISKQTEFLKATSGPVLPGRYRILGSLQTIQNFAELFACSENSTMNKNYNFDLT